MGEVEYDFPCGCCYVRRGRTIMLAAHGDPHRNIFNVLEMLPKTERIRVHLHLVLHDLAEHLLIRPFKRTSTGLEDSLGESVAITMHFTHLLPECVEIQVIHFHQVRLEVRDSTGAEVQSWQWHTNTDLAETVTWKPQQAGAYFITASSWWNGEKLEAEGRTQITISEEVLPPEVIPSYRGFATYVNPPSSWPNTSSAHPRRREPDQPNNRVRS